MTASPFLLLMPSYNQSHYLAEAVRSVLAQSDPNWELWILDNSTDDTPAVIAQFPDRRIHFHHIAERMDPGTCLNWLLARASGRDFSYVHTDNNLHPAYVHCMREALSGHTMGLAFCDMRIIRGDGSPRKLKRRLPVDLARIMSLDVLGVPFAATTSLAQAIGGFKPGDFADDARFCASAFGLAEFVYVRRSLVDYRIHGNSRSIREGNMDRALQRFLAMLADTSSVLTARGFDPLAALRTAVADRFEELEWLIEDLWYRRLSLIARPWWSEGPPATHLFQAGLLRLQGFSRRWRKPPMRLLPRRLQGVTVWPWSLAAMAVYLLARTPEFRQYTERIEQVLLPWAYLTGKSQPQRFLINDAGIRTVVSALLLESRLGWLPAIHADLEPALRWTGFPVAEGNEPVLRMYDEPVLELSLSADDH